MNSHTAEGEAPNWRITSSGLGDKAWKSNEVARNLPAKDRPSISPATYVLILYFRQTSLHARSVSASHSSRALVQRGTFIHSGRR